MVPTTKPTADFHSLVIAHAGSTEKDIEWQLNVHGFCLKRADPTTYKNCGMIQLMLDILTSHGHEENRTTHQINQHVESLDFMDEYATDDILTSRSIDQAGSFRVRLRHSIESYD